MDGSNAWIWGAVAFLSVCLRLTFGLSTMANVTRLLDDLLKDYTKEIRPGYGEGPLFIETDILVRSMGPIVETDMVYSMQCYLRQRWKDERLRFNLENITEVTLSNTFLKNIWKPNTFFLNGRRSTQHNITTPNVFVRIRDDGRIYMSRRITINAACPLQLMDYPMDRPVCPLFIGGYGYTTRDIVYIWKFGNGKSVEVYDDVTMSQFDMGKIYSTNITESSTIGEYSILKVNFYLKRHLGFFILQTYVPCTLIVCLSWVSFWINRDAAPARVLLGVTTILSTAAIGMVQRDGLPKVPYATALDVYMNVCILYLLAAMIQYAAVNYFTKLIQKDGGKPPTPEPEDEVNIPLTSPHRFVIPEKQNGKVSTHVFIQNEPCYTMFWQCLIGNFKYRAKRTEMADKLAGNSVSQIDILARVIFPWSFGLFQIGYWAWYLNHKSDPDMFVDTINVAEAF